MIAKKLRIMLLMTSSFDIGGGQRDVLTLAEKLAEREHFVVVVSKKGELAAELKHENTQYLEMPLGGRSFWKIISTAIALRKLIARKNIHIVNPESIMTTLLTFLALRIFKRRTGKNIPIITTIHNIHNRKNDKLSVLILNICPDFITFVSEYERQRLIKEGLKNSKTKVVYSGIDPKIFDISNDCRDSVINELGIPLQNSIVGTISRLSKEKGHIYFLEAAAKVTKVFPQASFLIVGDGPEKKNLQELAFKLKIAESVIFTGFRRDIYRMLSAMDVFVLTSLRESLPVSIREAMAMGKPVVATDVGGVSEVVGDNISGFLVPAKNPDALARTILELLKDKERAITMGKKGRQVIRNRFSMDAWVNKTEQAYEESLLSFQH